ncbi:MAG TPA: hypothetical protein VGN61_05460 [Verrucomicrobiae bacterium]
MKALYYNVRLIFSGDTVLLFVSIALFLASLANATQWQVLRGWRFCGICTTFLSVGFLLFTGFDLLKNERQKRTLVAAVFFLAATALCFSGMRIEVVQ